MSRTKSLVHSADSTHSADPARPVGLRPSAAASRALGRLLQIVHVVALCVLAYVASARLVDLTGMLVHRAGMAWADAVLIASMAGFLVMLLILLWAFSRRSALHGWLGVGGLAGLAALAARALG